MNKTHKDYYKFALSVLIKAKLNFKTYFNIIKKFWFFIIAVYSIFILSSFFLGYKHISTGISNCLVESFNYAQSESQEYRDALFNANLAQYIYNSEYFQLEGYRAIIYSIGLNFFVLTGLIVIIPLLLIILKMLTELLVGIIFPVPKKFIKSHIKKRKQYKKQFRIYLIIPIVLTVLFSLIYFPYSLSNNKDLLETLISRTTIYFVLFMILVLYVPLYIFIYNKRKDSKMRLVFLSKYSYRYKLYQFLPAILLIILFQVFFFNFLFFDFLLYSSTYFDSLFDESSQMAFEKLLENDFVKLSINNWEERRLTINNFSNIIEHTQKEFKKVIDISGIYVLKGLFIALTLELVFIFIIKTIHFTQKKTFYFFLFIKALASSLLLFFIDFLIKFMLSKETSFINEFFNEPVYFGLYFSLIFTLFDEDKNS